MRVASCVLRCLFLRGLPLCLFLRGLPLCLLLRGLLLCLLLRGLLLCLFLRGLLRGSISGLFLRFAGLDCVHRRLE